MTFTRAVAIALMTSLLVRNDGGIVENMLAIGAGGLIWWLSSDPLPNAIRRGLEAFAEDYRGRRS